MVGLLITDFLYRINKVYTYLANLIFWNMILRMFLEGYMEYAITSLMNLYKVSYFIGSKSYSFHGNQEVTRFLQSSRS